MGYEINSPYHDEKVKLELNSSSTTSIIKIKKKRELRKHKFLITEIENEYSKRMLKSHTRTSVPEME